METLQLENGLDLSPLFVRRHFDFDRYICAEAGTCPPKGKDFSARDVQGIFAAHIIERTLAKLVRDECGIRFFNGKTWIYLDFPDIPPFDQRMGACYVELSDESIEGLSYDKLVRDDNGLRFLHPTGWIYFKRDFER